MSTSSELVRTMVLRELQDGLRQDGLWLQAMSESGMDPTKAKSRYIALRTEALQSDMKGRLIEQIRHAVAQDSEIISSSQAKNQALAADLAKRLGAK